MVDTHAHLSLCEDTDAGLVAAARAAGVARILTVGIDEDSNSSSVAAAAEHDEVFACVGRHPNGAAEFDDDAARAIEQASAEPGVRAIGETGLDYYRDRAPRAAQRAAFEAHIGIARRSGLPLVIHMRESLEDTFDTLARHAVGVTVVLHCFGGTAERAAEAAGRGWYLSFAGNVTYPRAEDLREAAAAVPADRLLVETDSPFLAPQPVRGRPNQPANVVATARTVASQRGLEYDELERLVDENAARVFGW